MDLLSNNEVSMKWQTAYILVAEKEKLKKIWLKSMTKMNATKVTEVANELGV